MRESEEKYRLLADNPEMIYLIGKDDQCRINGTAASQLHAKPLELVGKRVTEIFPADYARQNLESIQSVIDTKEPSFHETFQKFPAGDIWVETRLSPLIDKSGEVFAVLGRSGDITERKRAEETLAQEQYLMNILMDNVPIISTSKTGTVGLSELTRTTPINLASAIPHKLSGSQTLTFLQRNMLNPPSTMSKRLSGPVNRL